MDLGGCYERAKFAKGKKWVSKIAKRLFYTEMKKKYFFLGGGVHFCVLPQCGKTFLVVYKRIEEFCRLYLQKSTILP